MARVGTQEIQIGKQTKMTKKIKTECCEKCRKETSMPCPDYKPGSNISCAVYHCKIECSDSNCPCHNTPAKECKTSPHCSHNTNGRDMDKPCSVEFNPKEVDTLQGDSWEIEFENKFVKPIRPNRCYNSDEIIDFIRQTILQEKARVIIEVEKICMDTFSGRTVREHGELDSFYRKLQEILKSI